MEWLRVAGFIKRFAAIRPPAQFLSDTVMRVVRETAKVAPPDGSVSVRGAIVYITGLHPVERSEIAMKKREIISALNKELPRKISDIRF